MSAYWTQEGAGVRLEWGPTGARHLIEHGPRGCLVVVDVLSFTTAVSVAVQAGAAVLPYRWRDHTAAEFARTHDADLAVGRRATGPDSPWSLSPAALRRAPFSPRLVLPSPNGSTIAAAAPQDMTVAAACLRNAGATARWLLDQGFGTPDRPVLLVPAGERWPDGSLRPALEDLLGAGAVASALAGAGRSLSAEAEAGQALFDALGATTGVPEAVRTCGSGRELVVGGFGDDVEIAAEIDASPVAAVRVDGAFAPTSPGK
ncbi:MAG TPA: 2-phosphosulfolactate phosphatase [Actinopolymorphaceae bacterium]